VTTFFLGRLGLALIGTNGVSAFGVDFTIASTIASCRFFLRVIGGACSYSSSICTRRALGISRWYGMCSKGIEKYFLPKEINLFSVSDSTGAIDKRMGRNAACSNMITTMLNRLDRNN